MDSNHDTDAAAHNAHGNALFAERRFDLAAASYRAALALAPGEALLHFNLGNALAEAGAHDQALHAYRAALARNPDHAGTHTNLANLLHRLKRPHEALEHCRRAVFLQPQDGMARYNLGIICIDLHRPHEAVSWFEQATQCSPPYLPAIPSAGEALLRAGDPEAALPWFERAVQTFPDDAQARLGRGITRLTLGDFTGWTDFEARNTDARTSGIRGQPTAPLWDGSTALSGRSILLTSEQGAGDTLQFVRYTSLLRAGGARVILQVPDPLVDLLRPLADLVLSTDTTAPPADVYCPLMSLPHAFRTGLSTIPADIPYIAASPSRAAAWRARLGPPAGGRIGLAWSGNPEHMTDALRSIPAEFMQPLLDVPGYDFHLLQKQIRDDDRAAIATAPHLKTHAQALHSFDDTAALITQMDLVITVDTAIAHLAGAMGRPVWLLLPYAADFRWMRDRTDSPWYPTARLFRQTAWAQWPPVIDQIAAALRAQRGA